MFKHQIFNVQTLLKFKKCIGESTGLRRGSVFPHLTLNYIL